MADNPETRKHAEAAGQAAEQAGDKSGEAAKRGAEAVAQARRRGAEAAADVTRLAAAEGQDAAISSLRVMSAAQKPLTDVAIDQSQRALQVATRVTDVYRHAAERGAEDVRALINCWMKLGYGLQHWQHAYFEQFHQMTSAFARKRQKLATSNSPTEFPEVQRDLYVDLVSNTLRASTTLLQLAAQISQEAVHPLQQRARAA